MPTLDVTFTWALPVHAARLTAHVQAYISTLPALNTLRACNRFGKGPQCYITKLPVELVQRIAHYYIVGVRRKNRKQCNKLLRCYEAKCTVLDHFTRDELLEFYLDEMDDELALSGEEFWGYQLPSDEELIECLGECGLDEYEGHLDNKSAWELRMKDYLENEQLLLSKHFGINTWLSRVCIGTSERLISSADTAIAYLTLPNRDERKKSWARDMTEDGYDSTDTGYGFAVAIDQHNTPRELQNFKRAMKILGLKLFIHPTQEEVKEKGLSSVGSADEKTEPVVADTAASFPRPLLLVRNHIDGE